jgi:hypothetical protein
MRAQKVTGRVAFSERSAPGQKQTERIANKPRVPRGFLSLSDNEACACSDDYKALSFSIYSRL